MSYFPAGATSGGAHRPNDSFGAIDDATMFVFWDGGSHTANYNVLRFGTISQASRFYALAIHFAREDIPELCTELGELDLNAREFEIGCGQSSFGGYKGDLAARYEEFVISLVVGVDSSMTLDDFAQVVRYIDDMMTERLGLEEQ